MTLLLLALTALVGLTAGLRTAGVPRHERALVCVAALLVAIACFAGALAEDVKVRAVVAFVCLLFLLVYLVGSPTRRTFSRGRDPGAVVAVLLLFVPVLTYEVLSRAFALDGGQLDRVWRFGVEFPLCAAVGYLLIRERLGSALARTLLAVGLVLSVLALVEQVRSSPLIDTTISAALDYRYGSFRARIGAEHPLVLGTIVLVGVPIAVELLRGWRRILAVLLLVGGIQATGSRGALAILAAYLLYVVLESTLLRHPAVRRTAFFVAAVVAAVVLFAGSVVDTVSSVNADTASTQYRGALYSFIPTTVLAHPIGWGWTGLPHGVYLLSTSFGVLDIADTVDSEVVLAALDAGLLGLALYAFVAVLPMLAPRSSPLPRALSMITLSGLYLALHAWAGLGALWWLLIGAVYAQWRTSRGRAGASVAADSSPDRGPEVVGSR